GDGLAHEEPRAAESVLDRVESGEQSVEGGFVGFLGPGESAAVDAVVDLRVDQSHHLLHLLTRLGGPEIRGTLTMVGGPLRGEVLGDLREVVGHDGAGGDVDDGGNGDAARVVWEAGEERLLEAFDPEDGIDPAGIEVEGPRSRIVGGTGHAQRDDVLEPEQAADDDRAIRPRAGPRGDETVPARFDGPLSVGIVEDAVVDVVRVALEFLARG